MKENSVLVIAGPTASGKSALAKDAAKMFGGVVINGDSMQIYKDIPVISAAPDEADKAEVEHRLYGLYDSSQRGNVADWLDLCAAEIKNAHSAGKLPVVAGGTGFYLNALLGGVSPIPPTPHEIREKVSSFLKKNGTEALYEYLLTADEQTALRIGKNDKTRLARAVEIIEHTGVKVSDWYKKPLVKKVSGVSFCTVKIMPPLDVIEQRCRLRLDKMVYELDGLKEIENLVRRGLPEDLPAMKALGVPELSMYVRGEKSFAEAMELAKLHTRQYAKRQRTWLKNKISADITFEDVYKGQPEHLQRIGSFLQF